MSSFSTFFVIHLSNMFQRLCCCVGSNTLLDCQSSRVFLSLISNYINQSTVFYYNSHYMSWSMHLLWCCSLCVTCVTSLLRAHRAMLPTVRNDFVERSLMEHGTSLQAGWSYRRPSPRSRCYCQSRSWMATQRRCWPTLQRQQGNCVSSLLRRLALLTDLAFHST